MSEWEPDHWVHKLSPAARYLFDNRPAASMLHPDYPAALFSLEIRRQGREVLNNTVEFYWEWVADQVTGRKS